MNQKQLMLKGRPYRANDDILFKERTKARKLIQKYNNTSPTEIKKRDKIVIQTFR